MDHVLVQCPYAKMVWFGCLRDMNLQILEPQGNTTWEDWWTEARSRIRRADRRRFDSFILWIAWTIWKQRNARVFRNTPRQLSTEQIIKGVKEEFALWELARGRGGVSDLVVRE